MTLNDQQMQSVLEGNAIEIALENEIFYLLPKQQYDELQRIRAMLGQIEEIEFSPYEADDIVDSNDGAS